MTIENLNANLITASPEEIIGYVSVNAQEIKLLFNNLESERHHLKECILLITRLNRLKENVVETEEIQFLFTCLAFYFKSIRKTSLITTCITHLKDSILKYRLQAWHKYNTYKFNASHANLFPQYLELLSSAASNDVEDYTEDVLLDLHYYYIEHSKIENFKVLFDDRDLLVQYPLLREYTINQDRFTYRTIKSGAVDKIYTPSKFAENLFAEKFINYIRHHGNTRWHEILLGYDSFTARRDIIQFGQADFDKRYKDLQPDEVVKLYCYFNMRKHFYSTLHLLEINPWINHMIMKGNTKFIDVGCGPATSGIALVDHLLEAGMPNNSFEYIGIDYYGSMLAAASDIMDNDEFDNSRASFLKSIDLIDLEDKDKTEAIFLNTCYLFASPTLEVDSLAADINTYLGNYGSIPKFLLFQNTTEPSKNIKYREFKKKLTEHKLLYADKIEVKYNNQRHGFWRPTTEMVSYEILKFK
ncbi:hypothetical protein [Flavobacterium reichenbachii]|uniref:Methyltransferase domain-containing protein n=1 Tax=Flavobacterium reichenbachii TaxID=362418 RepID=A0A085ZFQ8_9FLAO|nr:hypothetical protein [Flavobacterium reichenbachii]KFF03272.1 hypothetical protein IW19_20455 [Flavobacterium reichenbachii]OXB15253.1 hypothetical protein B0A68_11060 [Flavobacterium reichenbachii]